jgi:hypothetical protein
VTPWQTEAVCALEKIDPDNFFYEGRFPQNSFEYREHIAYLRSLCFRCPCRIQCRDYADSLDIRDGFFGGETPTERLDRRWPNRAAAQRRAAALHKEDVVIHRPIGPPGLP